MPFKYSLTAKAEIFNEEVTATGEFTDEEYELLLDFEKYAAELYQTPYLHKGNFARFTMTGDNQNNLAFKVELPDWNEVSVFLHKIRPFILQNERTYFHKVRNLLGFKLTNSYFRDYFNLQKELFNGKKSQEGWQIESNGEILNSEKILYEWLNAHEYHRDKDKQELIKFLHQIVPLEASKVLFLGLLSNKTKAILNLASFIYVLLGKQKSLTLQSEIKTKSE